ncbi:MAG TPA: LCCL domain-containing protein [Kofleriaceae bacterium]|nr:LCCL domain-containing protein [Kofleriaceae bacterium]
MVGRTVGGVVLALAGLLAGPAGCAVRGGVEASIPGGGGGSGDGEGGGPAVGEASAGDGGETIEAGCGFNGTQLKGEIGAQFQVSCPAHCEAQGGTWGSDVYTLDSAVCRAGIHAGAIPKAGGVVQVRIAPGRPAYRGSARNGIQSGDYGSYGKSFEVVNAQGGEEPGGGDEGKSGSEVVEAGCSYNGTQIVGDVGTRVVVSCPAGCASQGGLWGSGAYTLDSSVCRAAIHAGVITDDGGNAAVLIEKGRPAYRGSTQHGVQSGDYGSYGKSFRVERP